MNGFLCINRSPCDFRKRLPYVQASAFGFKHAQHAVEFTQGFLKAVALGAAEFRVLELLRDGFDFPLGLGAFSLEGFVLLDHLEASATDVGGLALLVVGLLVRRPDFNSRRERNTDAFCLKAFGDVLEEPILGPRIRPSSLQPKHRDGRPWRSHRVR